MNLEKILKKHKMWLNDEEGGERANLSGFDLSYTDLSGDDLRGAYLCNADLRNAYLHNTDLRDVDLYHADLRNAHLYNADLRDADLRCANLTGTDLKNVNLMGIKTNMYTSGYNLACPEEGSFIGYKKAGKCIVKLLIPEDAKRSSATTAKCRCDKAKVLDIEDIMTGEKIETVNSNYDTNFTYIVGEMVYVDDFDDNRWNECSTGVHFFMNRENAINY